MLPYLVSVPFGANAAQPQTAVPTGFAIGPAPEGSDAVANNVDVSTSMEAAGRFGMVISTNPALTSFLLPAPPQTPSLGVVAAKQVIDGANSEAIGIMPVAPQAPVQGVTTDTTITPPSPTVPRILWLLLAVLAAALFFFVI